MPHIQIINTFPEFLKYWEKNKNRPIDIQIENWSAEYMAQWSELFEMQIGDYASQQIAWDEIARDKVFPLLNDRLPAMQEAQQNIMATFDAICNQAIERLNFDSNIICIIYVGIGCGAGWVTTYGGTPAILFGLENIAECHWSTEQLIIGLTAHELGHVAHFSWRAQAHKPDGEGPWWQLFTEGFAQRCEHIILQKETWHETGNADKNWVAWCSEHKKFLSSEFLRFIIEKKDVRPFFGSWYEIEGHSQCGYFLGHEVIKALQSRGMTLEEIGILDHPESELREILESFTRVPLP